MQFGSETYYALLTTAEWQKFRRDFVSRKGFTCEKCGKTQRGGLQVHHKVYRDYLKPWEYDDSDLQCLCVRCHQALHAEKALKGEKIPVFPQKPYNCPNISELSELTTKNRDKNGTSDYLSDSIYGLARELSERKKMFFTPIPYAHYRECKLSEGKEWFVSFYVQDPETSKLRRIRYKLNRIKSISERRRTAGPV